MNPEFDYGLAFLTGLFGALHCTNETGWLYARLLNQASPTLQRDMVNVLVIGEHQDGPLETLCVFSG